MLDLLLLLLLLGLTALVVYLVLRLRELSDDAQTLKRDMAALRALQSRASDEPRITPPARSAPPMAEPPRPAPAPVAPPPSAPVETERLEDSAPEPIPTLPSLGANRLNSAPPAQTSETQLSLLPDSGATPPPLPVDVLIRALQFPETPDDTEGFHALRRSLRDHKTSQLVQAAQDVLTLLSQEGLYMDDLPPDRAKPELWRRFAQGERGGPISALASIHDRAGLSLIGNRLREDAVFRDTVHHFLRRFDKTLTEIEPDASDTQIVELTDTRTARAFILLGRVANVFE
ncbi:MAG: hypothetical protein OIF40_17310 [Mangrovicoccus sp.]|nr:hypothetical protein [Mangrovicoccus sp.]